jgi:hypothetical protein
VKENLSNGGDGKWISNTQEQGGRDGHKYGCNEVPSHKSSMPTRFG